MRELTFYGFLQSYVKSLAGQNTLNIRVLASCCVQDPRLREPLFLYALMGDKIPLLERSVQEADDPLRQWCHTYTKAPMLAALETENPAVPENFHKVWRSYLSKKNRVQSERHTKELMRSRLLRLQQEKKLSNYRLYTDLKLNPGNMNAWLKHGDGNKISLAAARTALHYAQQYRPR